MSNQSKAKGGRADKLDQDRLILLPSKGKLLVLGLGKGCSAGLLIWGWGRQDARKWAQASNS